MELVRGGYLREAQYRVDGLEGCVGFEELDLSKFYLRRSIQIDVPDVSLDKPHLDRSEVRVSGSGDKAIMALWGGEKGYLETHQDLGINVGERLEATLRYHSGKPVPTIVSIRKA